MKRPSDAAMHEAGHAVAAAYFGGFVPGEGIVLEDTSESFGYFRMHIPPSPTNQDALRRICVAVAGALAQVKGTRRRWQNHISRTDMDGWLEGLIQYKGFIDEVKEVKKLFRRPRVWRIVKRMAAALDKERTMGTDRMREFTDDLADWYTG